MCTRICIAPVVLIVLLAVASCNPFGIGEESNGGTGTGNADLVLDSIEVNGTSPVESFTLNMRNIGTEAANGFEARILFCEYPLGHPLVCSIVYAFEGLSLTAGQVMSVTVLWEDINLSELEIPGDFAVSAYVDATGIIPEPDEDNNFAYWDGTLSISY